MVCYGLRLTHQCPIFGLLCRSILHAMAIAHERLGHAKNLETQIPYFLEK